MPLARPSTVLAGLSVIGSVISAARATAAPVVRLAHLVMAAAMLAMTLIDQGWIAPTVLVATMFAANRVAHRLDRDHGCLPCMVDLIGMAIAIAAMAMPSPAGSSAMGHSASVNVVTVVGVTGCLAWIVCAGWLHSRPASVGSTSGSSGTGTRVHSRPLLRHVALSPTVLASTAMATSMSFMLLEHA